MKAYKVVVRFGRYRRGPFSDALCQSSWFPTNGKPGMWLPRTEPVAPCSVGWHFFRNAAAVRRDAHIGTWPRRWWRSSKPGVLEWWQIHYRQATHWENKSAARTIRFVRKLSREEVVALMEGA